MNMQPEILEHIKDVSGCGEMYDVETLKGFRRGPDGVVEVDITILDAGLWETERFRAIVKNDRGQRAIGEARPDLYSAISAVPWQELGLGPAPEEHQVEDSRSPAHSLS